MWSSNGGEERIKYKDRSKRRAPSCSSSQSHSPSSPLQTQKGKNMEEVWKDISLSSVHHHSNRPQVVPPHHHHNTFGGINLEDFLATPFSRDPPPNLGRGSRTGWCPGVAPPPQPQPQPPQKPPPTRRSSLCFPSVPEFHCVDDNNDPLSPHLPPLHNHSNDFGSCFVTSLKSPFGSCSGPAFPPFAKKRGSESEDNSKDRRHKRMIKNRESAARSRARKQSYTYELEDKVHYLTKENERLVKQQKELYLAAEAAAAAAPLPKKRTLQRCSTAPF